MYDVYYMKVGITFVFFIASWRYFHHMNSYYKVSNPFSDLFVRNSFVNKVTSVKSYFFLILKG